MPPKTHAMVDRPAAQLVIERLLLEQSQLRQRSVVARIFGLSPLGADSVSWYLSALGEITVGRILANLPAEWTTFHALPIGNGSADIDHLVIGPAGLFSISTKHHSGRQIWVSKHVIMVSGQTKPYLQNSENEADRVSRLLGKLIPELPPAQPLIVIVDPQRITVKLQPKRVSVVTAKGLRRWLLTRPPTLEPAQLAALRTAIDDPVLWRVAEDGDIDVVAEFTRLDRDVRLSRIRRIAWTLGLMLTALATVSLVVQNALALIAR